MFNRFGKNKKESMASGPAEFLIVGLGNPGPKYAETRHNVGFLFIDALAETLGIKADRFKFDALTVIADIASHKCILAKPQTFMNRSGESVREAARFYKIPPEKVLVIFDDTSLELGKLRIRVKGSDGGHNGIKNIIYHLNSNEFPRIKIGIGQKPHEKMDLADFVLSRFAKDEAAAIKAAFEKSIDALPFILDGRIDTAMNCCN